MDALKDVIERNDIKLEMKQLDGELARLEGLEAATRISGGQGSGAAVRLDQGYAGYARAEGARGKERRACGGGGRTGRTARDKVLAGSEGMAGEHEGTDAEDDEARREGLGLGGRGSRDGRGDDWRILCRTC